MNFQHHCRKEKKLLNTFYSKQKEESKAEENKQTNNKVRFAPSGCVLVYISPNFLASGSH